MKHRTILWPVSGLLAATVLAATPLAYGTSSTDTPPTASSVSSPSTAPTEGAVMAHMFQWPWDSVARECTDFLGPNGYDGVQVSPPQEHVVLQGEGFPWWQDYQPVSYQLDSRRGDRSDFSEMVATCNEAGVDIYVDAVLNHMTGSGSVESGPGSAGSEFEKYSYPGIYENSDFSECRADISNWDDPDEIRNCELLSLADLRTGEEGVRSTLTGYLNDLIDLGVAGFRIDAAKHVPPQDLEAIVSRLDGDPYVFQEVIEDSAISPAEYTGTGEATDFAYSEELSGTVRDGSLAQLKGINGTEALNSDQATVFVDNHDTQRNDPTLTYKDGDPYNVATAFMLAHPYGTPKVMSSFDFEDPESGPPAASNGMTSPANCEDEDWVCEHRQQPVAGMVEFRSVAAGSGVTDWWDNGNDQVAFGRGENGFAVFNRGADLSRTFQTSLPEGTYCDVASGSVVDGRCTGETYEIDTGGVLSASVASDSVLGLHVGTRL
ncbi:alpha-amylase [Haloactinospora alba]|uniref:Alpha-amylase n=1 Tax=Haloactinospora alba TaxID=405555 RepID=A0A543NII4_9ACTN|nr:alpha-amylase family protein [Haloactinospora alba]TQN31653.1 alpha-amylase [Haloactinospora alba]